MALDLVVLGVGAGNTHVYYGEPSSSFIIRLDGRPLLILDVGLGTVRAAYQHAGGLPQHIYVSHNHSDHSGELPVLLAVEAQAGRQKTVLAEPTVLKTLLQHRLHELQSTGQQLDRFGQLRACAAGQLHHLPEDLSLLPVQSRHAERCFGLLLHWKGKPVLGWSADSGYDAALYCTLAQAPIVLLDGRAKGNSEHAGFSQLQAAASSGILGSAKCYVYGYGTLAEAPSSHCYPGLTALQPGTIVPLAEPQQVAAQAPLGDAVAAAATAAIPVLAAAAVHGSDLVCSDGTLEAVQQPLHVLDGAGSRTSSNLLALLPQQQQVA